MQVVASSKGMCNSIHLWPCLDFGGAAVQLSAFDGSTSSSGSQHQPEQLHVHHRHHKFCCTSLAQGTIRLAHPKPVTPGTRVQLGVLVEGPKGFFMAQSPRSTQGSPAGVTPTSAVGEAAGQSMWRWSDAVLHVQGPLPLAAPAPVLTQPLLPDWHYNMLLDHTRNQAYERALRCVRAKQQGFCTDKTRMPVVLCPGLFKQMPCFLQCVRNL